MLTQSEKEELTRIFVAALDPTNPEKARRPNDWMVRRHLNVLWNPQAGELERMEHEIRTHAAGLRANLNIPAALPIEPLFHHPV